MVRLMLAELPTWAKSLAARLLKALVARLVVESRGDGFPQPAQGARIRRTGSNPRNGAESQNRTGDTAIFSRVLYQLSYLGPMA